MTAFLSNLAGPITMLALASLLTLAVWIVKGQFAQQSAAKDQQATMRELRQILVGVDGSNGLRSEVRGLHAGREQQVAALEAVSVKVAVLGNDVKHLRAEFADLKTDVRASRPEPAYDRRVRATRSSDSGDDA